MFRMCNLPNQFPKSIALLLSIPVQKAESLTEAAVLPQPAVSNKTPSNPKKLAWGAQVAYAGERVYTPYTNVCGAIDHSHMYTTRHLLNLPI